MAKPHDEYYPLEAISSWLMNLLYAGLVLTVVGAISTIFEMRLLNDMATGNFETEAAMMEAADANDQRELALTVLNMLWYAGTGVLSLIWIYRSAHNARVRASRMAYTPAACVWWYFIPFATFWKPYGAMKEIWSETAAQAGESMDPHRALLGAWWFCWIVMNLVYNVSFRMALRADDIPSLLKSDNYMLFGNLMDIGATLLFATMVRKLSEFQGRRHEGPAPEAPAMPGANW